MSNGEQTNLGIAPNLGGLLCYAPCCIGLIFSIVVAIVEKQSRFLRFHAFQSLLFHGVMVVVSVALNIGATAIGFVSGVLSGIASIAVSGLLFVVFLGATVLLMMKAYNNEEFKLPTIGDMAAKWV